MLVSCGNNEVVTDNSIKEKIVVDPSFQFQEMIGFGGAFAWYCDRVTNSGKKDQIATLLFQDLGADIIRFKNWYYPDGYPAVKSTVSMSDDNSKQAFDATNQLFTMAKQYNPNVKILLSSWGPPASLKSNGSTRQGTLKKDANQLFMYDSFAEYWTDILDNTPYNPDYISIQNEPSYINSGWTTCEWAPTETASLPGYDIAFDKVFEKIQSRPNMPAMIGPESANIGSSSSGNTFSSFADVIEFKAGLGAFAYHPYNFNSATTIEESAPLLQLVRSYSNKPNIMTEYSDKMNWFATALFIHNTLTEANSSGYIYWKMAWAPPASGEDAAMISVTQSGDFNVTPFYYVMKHFARHIDAGYRRISVSSSSSSLKVTGFINPSKSQITVVIINLLSLQVKMDFEVMNSVIKGASADQSDGDIFYGKLKNVSAGQPLSIPAISVTTLVLDM